MYVAVKGGERAIDNAHAFLAEERRGDPAVAELGVAQIREQLRLAVNRVMAEGSLYDPDLAALAIKQARGDLIEAIFLIRAYRTTLPRLAGSAPYHVFTDRLLRAGQDAEFGQQVEILGQQLGSLLGSEDAEVLQRSLRREMKITVNEARL